MIIKSFMKKYDKCIEFPFLEVKNQLVLKGENGSGKTTLLKAIRGMISYKGSISERGYLIMNTGLPRLFTQNDLAFIFGIEKGKAKVKHLSKGNIQWLLLQCALTFDVLLLDEPLDGLDESRKRLLLEHLRKKKVLIATHTDYFNEFEVHRI